MNSLKEINSLEKLILGDIDSMSPSEGIEDFRTFVVLLLCVEGRTPPVGQHISKTQTICQLSEGDEKSIPAVKINIL